MTANTYMQIERQPTLTLAETLSLFLLDCKARRFTLRTIEWYEWYLGVFLKWVSSCPEFGITHLQHITPTHIRTYQIYLHDREFSSYSQHNAFRCLRRLFNFALAEELIAATPFRKVKAPKLERKILPAFIPDDVKRLLDKCRSPREKAIILVLLDSGVRAGELCRLDVSDVDMTQGTVRV